MKHYCYSAAAAVAAAVALLLQCCCSGCAAVGAIESTGHARHQGAADTLAHNCSNVMCLITVARPHLKAAAGGSWLMPFLLFTIAQYTSLLLLLCLLLLWLLQAQGTAATRDPSSAAELHLKQQQKCCFC
jgi:hypothetical protein